nr:MAG TPA: hypothetical protein [Caudoviricetes sp.]
MTQPCHKDTTPNQQCYDREHKRWRGGQCKRDENNVKGGGGTQSEHGDNTHHHTPPFNRTTG